MMRMGIQPCIVPSTAPACEFFSKRAEKKRVRASRLTRSIHGSPRGSHLNIECYHVTRAVLQRRRGATIGRMRARVVQPVSARSHGGRGLQRGLVAGARRRPRDRLLRGRAAGAFAGGDGAGRPLRSAHEFVWRHRRQPYDLTVYQLGNSSHARLPVALPLPVSGPDRAARRAPASRARRRAAAGRAGRATTGRSSLPTTPARHPTWPSWRSRASTATSITSADDAPGRPGLEMTAVHAPALAGGCGTRPRAAGRSHPARPRDADRPRRVPMRPRAALRAAHGIPTEAVLFGVFGGLTPEKRLPQILDAFRAVLRPAHPPRLLLAGRRPRTTMSPPTSPRADSRSHVTLTGYLEDDRTDRRHRRLRRRAEPAVADGARGLGPLAARAGGRRPDRHARSRAHLARAGARSPERGSRRSPDARRSPSRSTSWTRTIRSGSPCGASRRTRAARRSWRTPAGRTGPQHSIDGMVDDYERLLPLAAQAPGRGRTLPGAPRHARRRNLRTHRRGVRRRRALLE
jgi:hypothetical protein